MELTALEWLYLQSANKKLDLFDLLEAKAMEKKQTERMYSEEEVMNALHSLELKYNRDFTKIYEGMKEWFEQFKKESAAK